MEFCSSSWWTRGGDGPLSKAKWLLADDMGGTLFFLVVVVTGLSLIVLRYLGWTFVVGDGPGVGPLETWNLDSQGHFTGNVSFFGTVWDGPWFIWLVSGYVQWFSATDVGVNLAMDGNWTYGWSRSQGLSLILLNNFGMDLG